MRLKAAGNLKHVTSTRILKPRADRSYFYLIYGTEHWKGVQEFRSVEKKAIDAQEQVRNAAKYKAEVERTGQESLFGSDALNKTYEAERQTQLDRGWNRLVSILGAKPAGVRYEELIGSVLEIPMVWEADLKTWLAKLRSEGKIEISGLIGRQRVPRRGQMIKQIRSSG